MSIAMSILDEVEKQAAHHKANSIEELTLEIGDLSGIEIESLTFAMEALRKNSILANAVFKIKTIEGLARCLECESEYQMKQIYDACPGCNSYFKDIIEGKELKIKSITLIN